MGLEALLLNELLPQSTAKQTKSLRVGQGKKEQKARVPLYNIQTRADGGTGGTRSPPVLSQFIMENNAWCFKSEMRTRL